MSAENFSVREVEALRPRLREELRFSVQEQSSRRVCVIEDATASRFHRVGLAESRFLRELDGSRTVATILAQLARAGSAQVFNEHDALQILRWAKDNHLLALESDRVTHEREHSERALRIATTWLNPLVLKIPLARPDAFFTRIEPAFRWLLGGWGWLLWSTVLLVGALHVAVEWPRFTRDFDGILARENWLGIFAVWIGLKIAHEFAHGLWCKHFGAAVREVGAIFVLFVPMGYVDATASLGLASKWRRIMVSCAGLWMEFFLAALAAIVWARTAPGTLNTLAHNAVVTGTVVTLLFNANPLMRFDGYFILSDALEIPNLATRGRQWVMRALAWLLAGGRALRPVWPQTQDEGIAAGYGVLAWFWQLAVLAGLLAGASVALRGGGVLLAVVAAGAWLALPLARFWKTLAETVRSGSARWSALALRTLLIVAFAAALLVVPFARSVSAPAVVELADTEIIRAECPGFVAAVLVADGENVRAGQPLVALRNDEAQSALARARIDLEQQELRTRVAYSRQDVATFQAEEAKAGSLRKAVAQHESYVATLDVRATADGRVTNRRLAEMRGSFLQAGDEVLRLGRSDARDLKIAIAQEAEPHFRGATGRAMRLRFAGRSGVFSAALTRIEASATRELGQPALTALAGGPLALRRVETSERHGGEYELAEPHFLATARIETDALLLPGETARVKFRSSRRVTVWAELQRVIARWWKRYAERAA